MVVRELITKLKFEVDESKLTRFDKNVGAVTNNLKRMDQNLKAVAQGAVQLGQRLSLFATLPIATLGAASVKAASDAEETRSKFSVVFRDISGEADAAAKNMRDNFGLASSSAQKLLSDTGDLLSGFGFSQKATLDLAKQTNELAVDLASFTNIEGGAERASRALTKALLGERESVKELGIAILEKDVRARVELNTSRGLTFATERQAKAYATLQLAQEQSKNAIGDFARTQDGVANRTRVFTERLREVSEQFGAILLPIVNKVLGVLIKLLDAFSKLTQGQKTFILVVAGVVAAIGPALILFGTLVNVVLMVKKALLVAKIAMAALNLQVLLIPALIAAAIAVLVLFIDELITWVKGGDTLIGDFLGSWEDFRDRMKSILMSVRDFFVNTWTSIRNFVVGVIDDIWNKIPAPLRAALGKVLQGSIAAGKVALTAGALLNPVTVPIAAANLAGGFSRSNQTNNSTTVRAPINVTVNGNADERTAQEIGSQVREAVREEIGGQVDRAVNELDTGER